MLFTDGMILVKIYDLLPFIDELGSVTEDNINVKIKYEGEVNFYPRWQFHRLSQLKTTLEREITNPTQEPYCKRNKDSVKGYYRGYLSTIIPLGYLSNISSLLTDTYAIDEQSHIEIKDEVKITSTAGASPIDTLSDSYLLENSYVDLSLVLKLLIKNNYTQKFYDPEAVFSLLNKALDLEPAIRNVSSSEFASLETLSLNFFGKLGHDTLNKVLGIETTTTIEKQSHESLEEEINGRLWFDLDGLARYWDRYNLTKDDILHFADTGKIQICFDWGSSKIAKHYHCFEYTPANKTKLSSSIEFIPLPVMEPKRLDFTGYHTFELAPTSKTKYAHLATISPEDIRDFISNREIRNPDCYMNGYKLQYPSIVDHIRVNYRIPSDIILNEHHLLITSKEIRLFENKYLNTVPSSALAKTLKEEKVSDYKQLTIPNENSTGWLEILVETLRVHFPENRARDPKKASVVEWIKAEAKKKGINPSDNIANAIFTIIKPDNHNPKKPRG